jgi:STE24 endopeptidase
MFFLLSLFLRNRGLYEAFFMARQPLYAGFVFFAMLYSPIEIVLSVALHMLLRHNEYEADCFAVRTSGLGTALIEALRKLAHDNLANLTPHPFYVFLHYSHPPMVRRIRAIQAVSRQLFLFLPCRLGGRRWTH